MSFEMIGSSSFFAASKIESLISLLPCITHKLPIHKIVWCHCHCMFPCATVVRQYLITVEERQHTRNYFPLMLDNQNLTSIVEGSDEILKIGITEHWCSQIANAFGVDFIKLRQSVIIENRL